MGLHEEMLIMGEKAVEASRDLARLSARKKNTILLAMADEIEASRDILKQANGKDLEAARASDM